MVCPAIFSRVNLSEMAVTGRWNLLKYFDKRVRITVEPPRTIVGTFKSFDSDMNIILKDSEEIHTKRVENRDVEERTQIGFVLVRNETIKSIEFESMIVVTDNIPTMSHIPGSLTPAGRSEAIRTITAFNNTLGASEITAAQRKRNRRYMTPGCSRPNTRSIPAIRNRKVGAESQGKARIHPPVATKTLANQPLQIPADPPRITSAPIPIPGQPIPGPSQIGPQEDPSGKMTDDASGSSSSSQ